MSQVNVKLIRFNFTAQADFDNFINARLTAGYSIYNERVTSARPAEGVYYVDAREFDYLTDGLAVLHDLVICHPARAMSGYYLELPFGCCPAERDPAQDTHGASDAPVSKLRQAVLYMIEHGTSANAAAKTFGVASSNMGVTIARMRRNGEI